MADLGHAWVQRGKRARSTASFAWPICDRCGLVALRNPASQAAARKPCGGAA